MRGDLAGSKFWFPPPSSRALPRRTLKLDQQPGMGAGDTGARLPPGHPDFAAGGPTGGRIPGGRATGTPKKGGRAVFGRQAVGPGVKSGERKGRYGRVRKNAQQEPQRSTHQATRPSRTSV